jgi:hypothetical protein
MYGNEKFILHTEIKIQMQECSLNINYREYHGTFSFNITVWIRRMYILEVSLINIKGT